MFKKLREVCRKHFHLVAPPKTSVVTSYDQKTKTHSGDSDGTGVFGGFLGSGRFLALKFGFYKKFHRQNWLEIVGKQKYDLNSVFVLFLFCCLFCFLLVLVVLVVVLVLLEVVFFSTGSSSALRYFYYHQNHPPGPQKPVPGSPGPPRNSLLGEGERLLRGTE